MTFCARFLHRMVLRLLPTIIRRTEHNQSATFARFSMRIDLRRLARVESGVMMMTVIAATTATVADMLGATPMIDVVFAKIGDQIETISIIATWIMDLKIFPTIQPNYNGAVMLT
ncbi:hypothetical protein NECAME_08976 [Necator americanus]|uniref:Uncharacterized protein n=1 Tax=Necator americanus TaxID=51031 RepID=W2TFA3_NECAM|nr:hypothetical protein NECAME_08976 [Necator americanus]ETN80735.1 hypothetical protein NECAME_08976 [Necator americanus]